jgi:hypothetical protein
MTREEAEELKAGDQVIWRGKYVGTVKAVEFSFMPGGLAVAVTWPDGKEGRVTDLDDLERA